MHMLFHKFEFNYFTLSETFFYTGILSFFSGLMGITNAHNIFIGFRYYITQRFRKKDSPEKITYGEYRDQKLNNKFTYISVVILVVGIIFIITGVILGLIAIN